MIRSDGLWRFACGDVFQQAKSDFQIDKSPVWEIETHGSEKRKNETELEAGAELVLDDSGSFGCIQIQIEESNLDLHAFTQLNPRY